MISTKFDVVVFKKDMDNDDLPGFAKMIERNYDNGFRFLESFDAADLGFVVSSKIVQAAMSTAPSEGQDAAPTDQEASDRLTKSFQDLNKNEPMMTVLDAKTLAYLAYNRGHSIGNGTMDVIQITGNADFENWWIEFRKENGFGSEQAEAVHVFPPSDFPAFTAGYFFNQLKEPLRTHVMSQANNMLSEAESLHYALETRQFLDWDKTREGRAFWEDVTAYLKSGNVPIESAGSRLARQCMPDNYVFPAAKP